VGAALVVHALLIVALTAGIQWKQDNSLSVEAELWSAVPMAAAPKLVEVEAPPPPPAPKPEPAPKPVVKAPEPPAPNRDAEIALAKKRKVEEEKKLQDALKAEERRKEEVKKEAEKKAKAKLDEDKRKLEAKKEEERKDKERKEKEKERAEKERKEKEAKKQAEQKDSKAAAEEAKKLEAIRKENMKRMAGLAGASGNENATGTAMKASGPSDTYGGRIRARVKPNITFDPSSVSGNPAAEVEVRCAPDGTIVGKKLVKSSGNTAWDNAVLKAIDKTEILPRDTDGRVHSPLLLVFKPND
jgi:colicin import membrane protein